MTMTSRSIDDRWHVLVDGKKVRSSRYGVGLQWRARYRLTPQGKQTTKGFARKVDAQRWLDEVTTSVVVGQYVQPGAGKVTFRAYAETWRDNQVHRPSTADQVKRHLALHVYPAIGDMALESILQSDVRALVKRMSVTLAPATVQVVYRHVSAIFKSAVQDRKIIASPCVKIALPEKPKTKVQPVSTEVVHALRDAMPERYRALVVLAAGTGLRQGEAFGLTVDRVDFLRKTVRVDRQMTTVTGRAPAFGPPKTEASYRTVPLPQVVVDELAAHLAKFPAEPDGLVFVNDHGRPLRRSAFGTMWRRVTKEIGAEDLVFHGLRHYYASLLIRHGESVKTVQARLGHASAVETLDTYSHLWPDSDDRTRAAVDSVLGAEDPLRTESTR